MQRLDRVLRMVMPPSGETSSPRQEQMPPMEETGAEGEPTLPTTESDAKPQDTGPFTIGRYRYSTVTDGRQIVIVLGMHRSGTSLLANVLHLLGVSMVQTMPHASPANPTGFWERQDITVLQDEILAIIQQPIGKPSHALPFPAGWWRDLRLQEPKAKLRELVRSQLEEVPGPWGFKDPRTCRLLPLWAELFGELGITPRFVWALRHPSEAANSMTLKRPNVRPLSVEHSEMMWLMYNYDIVRYAMSYEPLIVTYDQWFDDAATTAEQIGQELGVSWRGTRQELEETLMVLVAREHRHHWHSVKPPEQERLSYAFYDALLAFRANQQMAPLHALLPSIQWIFDSLGPFVEMANQLNPLKEKLSIQTKAFETLRAKKRAREAELRELRNRLKAQDEASAVTHHEQA